MKVDISTNHIRIDRTLKTYIDRCLQFDLRAAQRYITRLTLRLSNINGPRGGVCQRCRVVASTSGLGLVVVSETELTIQESISGAIAKLGSSIRRRQGRRVKKRTRGTVPVKLHEQSPAWNSTITACKAHRPEKAVICESHRSKLGTVLDDARRMGTASREVLDLLEDKLELGVWIPGPSLPDDVVVMNSKLDFHDLLTGETRRVMLVYPEATVSVRNGVSVLSLLGSELLGRRTGDEIEAVTDGATVWGRIEDVFY